MTAKGDGYAVAVDRARKAPCLALCGWVVKSGGKSPRSQMVLELNLSGGNVDRRSFKQWARHAVPLPTPRQYAGGTVLCLQFWFYYKAGDLAAP